MSYKIFISYRRSDSEGIAGRIYDRLIQKFPVDSVFIDVDSIAKGADFVEVMTRQVSDADIVLVVIGAGWLNSIDDSGKRRLDRLDDPVRLELKKAIEEKKTIIPVLVGKAEMPSPKKMPIDLRSLSRRNAERVTHENFQADSDRLIRSVELAASALSTNSIHKNRQVNQPNLEPIETNEDEAEEFEGALKFGTADAIRSHISRWPRGATLESALSELERIDWLHVSESKDPFKLQWFVDSYPDSERAIKAKRLIAHIAATSQPIALAAPVQIGRDYGTRPRGGFDINRQDWRLTRRLFLPLGATVVGGTGFLLWHFGGIRVRPTLSPKITTVIDRRLHCATFSPDGLRFATAAYESSVRVWDAHTGAALTTFDGLSEPINWTSYSPDSRYLAACSQNGSSMIWNASDGSIVHSLVGHTSAVQCIEFSTDGSMVLTCSDDGKANVWSTSAGKLIATLDNGNVNALSANFSSTGSQIVVSLSDANAAVWDTSVFARKFILSGHQYRVWASSFSPDGSQIITASEDKTLRLWDSFSGQQIAVITGHSGAVNFAEFSPSGEYLVSGSADGTVRLWDAKSYKQLDSILVHKVGVATARFDRSSRQIVTASYDGTSVVLAL